MYRAVVMQHFTLEGVRNLIKKQIASSLKTMRDAWLRISNSYITGRRDVLNLLTSPSGATRPRARSINSIRPDYP